MNVIDASIEIAKPALKSWLIDNKNNVERVILKRLDRAYIHTHVDVREENHRIARDKVDSSYHAPLLDFIENAEEIGMFSNRIADWMRSGDALERFLFFWRLEFDEWQASPQEKGRYQSKARSDFLRVKWGPKGENLRKAIRAYLDAWKRDWYASKKEEYAAIEALHRYKRVLNTTPPSIKPRLPPFFARSDAFYPEVKQLLDLDDADRRSRREQLLRGET